MLTYSQLIDKARDIQDAEQYNDVASLAMHLSEEYGICEQDAHEIATRTFSYLSGRYEYESWYTRRAESGWGE